jgi:hypothetical protein
MKNHKLAQITFVNLLIILMIIFLYLAFLPAIISFINGYAVPAINGCPTCSPPIAPFNADQPTKDLLLAMINLIPIALIIMIIASGLIYAIPRPER